MDDTPEIIRQQMQETKLQLSEKLKRLEKQVADTVQSTETAVNSTMSAVDSVVHCVSNVFDVQRHIGRHPWLFCGGAVVLGYLAAGFMKGGAKKADQLPVKHEELTPITNNAGQVNESLSADSSNQAPAVAIEPRIEKSSSQQLREVAMGALIGVMEGVAASAVPRLVDYLTAARTNGSESISEKQDSPQWNESPEAAQRLHIASSENVRSRKSF